MEDKDVKWFGFAGGLCFALAFFVSGLISIIGLIIGIYMISKGSEVPKSMKMGIGVVVMNAIAFFIGVLPMILRMF